jgi:hypothetical protein
MTIINELLKSNCNLKNVKPVSKDFINENTANKSIEYAYTGSFKNLIYTVYTQNKPYKQYILIVDIDTIKVIS